MSEIQLFWRALNELCLEDKHWRRNVSIYHTWDEYQRQWWINRIKAQAAKEVPVAVRLIAKVIELRLRGENGNQA